MRTTERKDFRYKTTKVEEADFWKAICALYQDTRSSVITRFGIIHGLLHNLSQTEKKNYTLSRTKLVGQFIRFYWYPVNCLNLKHCLPEEQPPAFAEEIQRRCSKATVSFSSVPEFDRMQIIAAVNHLQFDDALHDVYTVMEKLPFSYSKAGYLITLNPYFYQFLVQNKNIIFTLNLVEYVKTLTGLYPEYSFVELILDLSMNAGLNRGADYRYFFEIYSPRFSAFGLDLSDCRNYYREFLSFQSDSVEEAVLEDKIRNMDLSLIPQEYYKPGPVRKTSQQVRNGIRVTERDPKRSVNALIRAEFTCEANPEHPLFPRKKDQLPYTKPLHLIPLLYAEQFEWSLDVESNIVSLCPACYERIMYGGNAEGLLMDLYMLRRTQLEKCGLAVTEEQLLNMYGITRPEQNSSRS